MFQLQINPDTGIPCMPPIPTAPAVEVSPAEVEENAVSLRWNRSRFGDALRRLEITPDKQIPKRDFLFRMLGKPCFPRGELVAVTGKAKSGKTYLCSALIAAAQAGRCIGICRMSAPEPGAFPERVLWLDTEQSEESTQEILVERILPLSGQRPDEPAVGLARVSVINLRAVSWQDRMNLIEAAIEITRPALVVFDGIRDVVSDINSIADAHAVVEKLMQLASQFNACIVCVLHQNKSAEDHTLRGALGTELQNKAFEAYECVKEENRTFTVSQSFTRKYDIVDKLRFSVGDDGLPTELQPSYAPLPEEPADKKPFEALPPLESRFLDENGAFLVADVFREAIPEGGEVPSKELEMRVMQLTGLRSYRRFNELRRQAIEQGVIIRFQPDPNVNVGIYRFAADASAAPSAAPDSPAGEAAPF